MIYPPGMSHFPAGLRPKGWNWILLAVLLALLVIPGTREVLVLDLRILTQAQGKTVAQGQPPSCSIYIIPNTEFSPGYQAALRAKSSESPDAYALACATGSCKEIKPPSPELWLNHPLAIWGAFRLAAVVEDRSHHGTNFLTSPSPYLPIAGETIGLLRRTFPTNGALALAQASLLFSKGDDTAALAALREAAALRIWQSGMDQAFQHHVALFRAAGLSALDSAIEASQQGGDTPGLLVCQDIRHHLNHLMRLAVEAGDDEQFRKLFRLVKDLQLPHWHGEGMRNYFRGFRPSDDLTMAMAKRLGREIPEWGSGASFDTIRGAESKALEDFLIQVVGNEPLHATMDPTRLARFRATEKQLSHECLIQSTWATIAGILSLVGFEFAVMFGVVALLYRRLAGPPGEYWLPRSRSFWFFLVPTVAALCLWVAVIERELLQEPGMNAPKLGNQPYWMAFLFVALAVVCHGLLHRSDLPKWLRLFFGLYSSWKSWLGLSFVSIAVAACFRHSTAECIRLHTLFLY